MLRSHSNALHFSGPGDYFSLGPRRHRRHEQHHQLPSILPENRRKKTVRCPPLANFVSTMTLKIFSQIRLDLGRMERERQRELGIRMDDGLHIFFIILNLINWNIIVTILFLVIFMTIHWLGGRHPFWSVGSTPGFPRIPSPPRLPSSPRLPLGPPGRGENFLQTWQLWELDDGRG